MVFHFQPFVLKKNNPFRVIIVHININSVRNEVIIKDNIDLLVSETKLDGTFSVGQFCINGYSTSYRLDRTSQGGGILLYITEDEIVNFEQVQNHFEGSFIEINLSKKKWLLSCS